MTESWPSQTSWRPWRPTGPTRPALSLDKALREISEKRGILYDPEVVDACLKVFSESQFKFD